MAYNFKKLSDVEVVETPADAANVLIEENGVIKRAPKSEVGGSQKVVVQVSYNEGSSASADMSFAEIVSAISAGLTVEMLLMFNNEIPIRCYLGIPLENVLIFASVPAILGSFPESFNVVINESGVQVQHIGYEMTGNAV